MHQIEGRPRRWLVTVAAVTSLVLLPTPASAIGDWDPNDVSGPLDLRWIGGVYTPTGDIKLTLSFYDPVPDWRFPRTGAEWDHGVWVRRLPWDPCCGEFGFIFRARNGALRSIWDEVEPTIPQVVPVERLSARTFRVRFSPPHPGPYRLRALSVWPRGDGVIRDRTGAINLGPSPNLV
jgi:hypothetical protein